MENFYVQLEVQVSTSGTKSVMPFVFENETDALAKHYTVLAAAAASTIPYHASFIIRSDGITTEGRVFDRRVAEVPEEG